MRSAEFEKIADLLAKEHKIHVKEGLGWAANIEKKVVYYKKNDIYTLSEDHILGLLLHEIAHIHYTKTPQIPSSEKNKELLHCTINMLEDITIEHLISNDYSNAGEILESTREELLDTLVRNLPKMKNVSLHEKSILYAATKFDGRGYKIGVLEHEKIGEQIANIMLARKDEIYKRKETNSLIPLAKDIVEILLKNAGEPTQNEKLEMMRSATESTEADKLTTNSQAKANTIKKLAGKGWLGQDTISETRALHLDKIIDQNTMIGRKLRSILKRNNAMEFAGRFRTGKLPAKRLTRIRINKDRKPFSRRIVKSNQSYAFAIAADISGSMWGSRYTNNGTPTGNNGDCALSAMHMTSEALRKAGIPRALILFGIRANIISPMTKLPTRWSETASSQAINKAGTGNTNIHLAINACTTELKKTKAERKIMVILTDGQSDEYALREAHQKARQNNIECIGITIGEGYGESCMNEIFADKRNIVIKDNAPKESIGQAFLKVLKDSITKSE